MGLGCSCKIIDKSRLITKATLGQEVKGLSFTDVSTNKTFNWQADKLPAGTYTVKAKIYAEVYFPTMDNTHIDVDRQSRAQASTKVFKDYLKLNRKLVIKTLPCTWDEQYSWGNNNITLRWRFSGEIGGSSSSSSSSSSSTTTVTLSSFSAEDQKKIKKGQAGTYKTTDGKEVKLGADECKKLTQNKPVNASVTSGGGNNGGGNNGGGNGAATGETEAQRKAREAREKAAREKAEAEARREEARQLEKDIVETQKNRTEAIRQLMRPSEDNHICDDPNRPSTWEYLATIAKTLGLGFASTRETEYVMDRANRTLMQTSFSDFIQDEMEFSGINEDSVLDAWIDLNHYIVLVNLSWIFDFQRNNATPRSLATYAKTGATGDNDNMFEVKYEEVPRLLTNFKDLGNISNMTFGITTEEAFSVDSNTDVIYDGTNRHISTFRPLEITGEGCNSCEQENLALSSNTVSADGQDNSTVSTTTFCQAPSTAAEYNKQLQKEIHKTFLKSKRAKKYKVTLDQPNLGLQRGTLIALSYWDSGVVAKSRQKQTLENLELIRKGQLSSSSLTATDLFGNKMGNMFNALNMADDHYPIPNIEFTGLYYIDGMKFKYDLGDSRGLTQELILIKPESLFDIANPRAELVKKQVEEIIKGTQGEVSPTKTKSEKEDPDKVEAERQKRIAALSEQLQKFNMYQEYDPEKTTLDGVINETLNRQDEYDKLMVEKWEAEEPDRAKAREERIKYWKEHNINGYGDPPANKQDQDGNNTGNSNKGDGSENASNNDMYNKEEKGSQGS